MKWIVAVMTKRSKSPLFIGFDHKSDAMKFLKKAVIQGGCTCWLYKRESV